MKESDVEDFHVAAGLLCLVKNADRHYYHRSNISTQSSTMPGPAALVAQLLVKLDQTDRGAMQNSSLETAQWNDTLHPSHN